METWAEGLGWGAAVSREPWKVSEQWGDMMEGMQSRPETRVSHRKPDQPESVLFKPPCIVGRRYERISSFSN